MKSSRNTSTSGKPASGRRTPARKTKAKKKTTRTMPVWMRNTLALIVVGVFSLTFYYFVIRPYSYLHVISRHDASELLPHICSSLH